MDNIIGNIKPFFQDEKSIIIHGNSEDLLEFFDINSVNAVITDPPYELTGHSGKAITRRGQGSDLVRDFGEWDREWTPKLLLTQCNRILVRGGGINILYV